MDGEDNTHIKVDGSGPKLTLWENVLRHFKDAVIVLGQDSAIAFFNQAAEELTRIPRTRVLGRTCSEVFPESPFVAQMAERARQMLQSETRSEERLRAHGKWIPVRITCVPLWNEGGDIDGTALVIQDLSYQLALEEAAKRHESLARLGTLVAGLAHEVRNPLAGIKGAAQLLAQRVPDDAQLAEYTEVISSEADRLSELVENMLQLGAPPKPKLAAVNVHRALRIALATLDSEIRKNNLILTCDLDPSLPETVADLGQVQQVLLNLIKNAIDAVAPMDERPGEIRIVTKMETDYHIMRDQRGALSYLRIEVNDNGPGIAPEERTKVFEPFFTTKDKGTGLGLAIAQRIISDHGGRLRFINRDEGGTSAWISLPIRRCAGTAQDCYESERN